MDDEYTEEDIKKDLAIMMKAGLVEIYIREDGEWAYSLSEKARGMTDEERMEAVRQVNEEDVIY